MINFYYLIAIYKYFKILNYIDKLNTFIYMNISKFLII